MSGSQVLSLHPDDLANLRSSGLSDETIMAMGCRSAEVEEIAAATGTTSVPSGGYSIPYPGGILDQTGAPYCRWRLRTPAARGGRYIAGLGDVPQLYIPPGFAALPPSPFLVITEGEKKAAKARQHGIRCVAIQGVWSWLAAGPRAAEDAAGEGVTPDSVPLPALLELALKHELVLVLGDSDLTSKPQPRAGLNLLTKSLVQRGVRAAFICCPPAFSTEGEALKLVKQGLDDWLLANLNQVRRSLLALFRAGEISDVPISDRYNGREISALYRGQLAFSRKEWLLWQESTVIWTRGQVRVLASGIGRHYRDESVLLSKLAGAVRAPLGRQSDKELAKGPLKPLLDELNLWLTGIEEAASSLWTAGCIIENVKEIDPALKMAQEFLLVPDNAWDTVPYHLAVQNGVVDLRTKTLMPPSPKFLVTMKAGAAYDPNATAPRFQRFLERAQPDPEVREYLQRHAGYCCTGTSKEQQLLIHSGAGMNMKGTFMGLLLAALGGYGQKGTTDMLAQKPSGTPGHDVAMMAGARLVSLSESDENLHLDENKLKSLTGGDLQTCRHLYKGFFSYKPAFSLVLDTNHSPQPREQGLAMWRRIDVLPWSVTITEKERIKDLEEVLKDAGELPGILTWMIDGAAPYLQDGLPAKPRAMIDATAKLRLESDELAPWLSECCILAPNARDARVQSSKLYGSHDLWRKRNGLHSLQGGNKAFKKRMEEKGFYTRPRDGKVFWCGLRLREPDESFEDAPDQVLAEDADPAAQQQPQQQPAQKPVSKDTTPEELERIPGAGQVV